MARKKHRKKSPKAAPARRSRRYTPVELIIAGFGALMLLIAIGMIVSSMLSK